MKLLIGDTEVSFSPAELRHMYVDEGLEAKIYRYGDKALKLYGEECVKRRLDEDTVNKLIGIPTKRILLPEEIISSSGSKVFLGYTTPFIDNSSKKKIPNMKMEHFLDEVAVIEDDIELLSNNGVGLYDFTMGNLLYNGNIYFCDPGSFAFEEEKIEGQLYMSNTFYFNEFILEKLFESVGVGGEIKRRTYGYDWNERLSPQMRKKSIPSETIKQYVKRVKK